LVLVNDAAEGGYFHVRTEDELVGWVWSKYVTVTTFVPQMPKEGPAPQATSCNADLWKHVYHPHRLIVKQDCISVTGKIVDATKGKKPDGVRHEGDGDTHGWLKLDPEFENLLNSGNLSDEEGNLVFEIVCKFPVRQADAKTACKGYQADIAIPPVGSHVRIVGTYVQDTFHAQWMEIHPVTSITVVPWWKARLSFASCCFVVANAKLICARARVLTHLSALIVKIGAHWRQVAWSAECRRNGRKRIDRR